MPESGSNVELAHELSAHGHHPTAGQARGKWLGIAEALVLAVVAIATAWSGYQASRWEGLSAKEYALDERYTVLAQERDTLAGQDRLYDTVTFNGWVQAKVAGREKLATFFERRFRPEYAVAFKAWWLLDPIHNGSAPPGPIFMREYKNANAREARRLAAVASQYFAGGVSTRERGDDYVRVTVLLATVLFLTALSQRFDVAAARSAIVATAAIFLLIGLFWLVTLPRT
jgi:hypothetical protein